MGHPRIIEKERYNEKEMERLRDLSTFSELSALKCIEMLIFILNIDIIIICEDSYLPHFSWGNWGNLGVRVSDFWI